jgi:hypothetical protein
MMTVKQAAKHACVCETVVRGWLKAGLPHYRLGLKRGKIGIQTEDLDAWLAYFRVVNKGPELVKAPALPFPILSHLRIS